MFNEKNSVAIYLERNSLVYIHTDKKIVEHLPFGTETINHLEIKDTEKFMQTARVFFEKMSQDSAVIFLAKPIIFEREIDITDVPTESLSLINKFLSMVPITPNKLGSKVLEGDGAILCMATNREYYELVIKSAELVGIKVTAVVPAFLFNGLEISNGIDIEKVQSALSDSDLISNTDFLNKNSGVSIDEVIRSVDPQQNEVAVEATRSKTKTIVLTTILIGLLSFSLIFSYMNGLFDRFFVTNNDSAQVVPSVTDLTVATQSGQPSPSPIAFSNLRASIKNGTGIAGQAAKAKALLDELKLEEVIVATDSSRGTTNTLLEYDPIVPEQLVLEVKSKLETVFAEVDPKEATNTGEFDFVITTGQE